MAFDSTLSDNRRSRGQALRTSQVQELILSILDEQGEEGISFTEIRKKIARANLFEGEVKSNTLAYHIKKCRGSKWITLPKDISPRIPHERPNKRGRYRITEKGRQVLHNSSAGHADAIADRIDDFKRRALVQLVKAEGENSPAWGPLEEFSETLKQFLNPINDPKDHVDVLCKVAAEWRSAGKMAPQLDWESKFAILKRLDERIQIAMENMRYSFLKYLDSPSLDNEKTVDEIREEFNKSADVMKKITDLDSGLNLQDGEVALNEFFRVLLNSMSVAPRAVASLVVGSAPSEKKQVIQILKKELDAINKVNPEKVKLEKE